MWNGDFSSFRLGAHLQINWFQFELNEISRKDASFMIKNYFILFFLCCLRSFVLVPFHFFLFFFCFPFLNWPVVCQSHCQSVFMDGTSESSFVPLVGRESWWLEWDSLCKRKNEKEPKRSCEQGQMGRGDADLCLYIYRKKISKKVKKINKSTNLFHPWCVVISSFFSLRSQFVRSHR